VDYEKTLHNLLKMRPFNPSTGSGRTGWLRLLVERRSWLEIVRLRVFTRRKFCNVDEEKAGFPIEAFGNDKRKREYEIASLHDLVL